MADLTQINGNQRIVMGWFGSCDDEGCEEYPLRTAEVVEAVDSIYEIHTDSTRAVAFHSYIYETLPNQTQSLESLKCGHSYYVALKAGDKTLTIEEFVIADESTTQERYVTVDDQCGGSGGGGGGMATISFLPDSPTDNGDMRISIGVDLTELNDLCSSNVWRYRIEKLANEGDETGDPVSGGTGWGPGVSDQETIISELLSPAGVMNNSATGGDSWYKVYIKGYSSTNVSTGVTDEVSAKVYLAWPNPILYVDTNECQDSVCHTEDVSYLYREGPSDWNVYTTADGPAIFSISRYLISFLKLSYSDTTTAHLWEFSLDLGVTWLDVSAQLPQNVTAVVNSHHIFDLYIRLKAKDLSGEDLAIGTYTGQFEFEYKGMEDTPTSYNSRIQVNAEVKPRTVTIQTLTDNRNLQVGFTLNLNNVTHYRFSLIGPDGKDIFRDTTSNRTQTTGNIAGATVPGTYTMEAWGVSEIGGEWIVVTPVDSKTVQVDWPDSMLDPTSTINEGYEEESGPSAGNDLLTIKHDWVTEYTLHMPDNGDDGAWEIKRNGETDDQYITIPTTPTSFLTRNDQISMSADVSDVYILRLKAGLPANENNGYDRTLLLNGTKKDGTSLAQQHITMQGQVSVKPPCCDGFPGGNTVQTKGNGVNVEPVTGNGGVAVWTVDFDDGGKLCFPSGVSGSTPTIYLVDLYDDENNKIEGWSSTMPYGQVWVVGAFTSTDAVYEHPNGTCYIGNLTKSDPDIMQFKDPGRNEGATLFGENDG